MSFKKKNSKSKMVTQRGHVLRNTICDFLFLEFSNQQGAPAAKIQLCVQRLGVFRKAFQTYDKPFWIRSCIFEKAALVGLEGGLSVTNEMQPAKKHQRVPSPFASRDEWLNWHPFSEGVKNFPRFSAFDWFNCSSLKSVRNSCQILSIHVECVSNCTEREHDVNHQNVR